MEARVITEEYVRERLARAAEVLAADPRPLQQRLFSAALVTSTLQPRDFVDEDDRAAFGAIRAMLTRYEPDGSEGRVTATLARMSDDEARAVAQHILELDARHRTGDRLGPVDRPHGEV